MSPAARGFTVTPEVDGYAESGHVLFVTCAPRCRGNVAVQNRACRAMMPTSPLPPPANSPKRGNESLLRRGHETLCVISCDVSRITHRHHFPATKAQGVALSEAG